MAKKIETTNFTSYSEVDHEQDSLRMREHINSKSAETEAADESWILKLKEEQKKAYSLAIGRYTLRLIAVLVVAFALYMASKADLIAPVLTIPATYLLAIYFGWCMCKLASLVKKGRVSK